MNFLMIAFSAFPPLFVPLATVAYLGPDSVVPLASVLAAVIGVVLMFGRNIWSRLRGGLQSLRHKDAAADVTTPGEQE